MESRQQARLQNSRWVDRPAEPSEVTETCRETQTSVVEVCPLTRSRQPRGAVERSEVSQCTAETEIQKMS